MADSEMTEHVSATKMERFCARALEEAELTTVARHIADCSDCGQQFVATLGRQKGTIPLSFTLAPEFWLRHEHIDYEELVELANKKSDATDRELLDLHLKVCPPCREDVASFLTFREEIGPELQVSYAPVGREPTRQSSWAAWWHGLARKPIHAAAVVLLGIALVVGATFFLKRRADNFQAKQTPTAQIDHGAPGQTPTPDNHAANSPSPPGATPNELPAEKPNSAVAIVSLNDLAGPVTVDKSGNISGFDDVPPPTRDEIARVLLSERIEKPAILRELAGQDSTLRGSSGQSFKLISPSRTVIVSDRPTFKWEKVSGVSTYRVFVNDPSGREAARSEELSSERTEWAVPKSLRRGEIYTWTVIAAVDGKEIVSPGPASPEMKFQVLPMSSLQQLNQLKRKRSYLARGVFYARVGMISEAEREFQELSDLNPGSQTSRNLLRSIQSLRTTGR